jgi:DNA modification methylase
MRALAALTPNPRNPNTHPPKQIDLLASIIAAQGWRAPITVSARSGFVVRGHGRLMAAYALGLEEAPVDVQEYDTEAAEWADLVADNRIAELAEIDAPALADFLREIETTGIDMDLTGFDDEAIRELLGAGTDPPQEDPGPQEDRAGELRDQWGVERGQVWTLGQHRIMCGDSTDANDVDALLTGAVPVLMVTDPPYGVEYDAAWRNEALRANGSCSDGRAVGAVSNDDRADWREAWALFPGDVAYVWHAGLQSWNVAESILDTGFLIRAQIIWAKQHLVISQGAYHFQHEPCWYAVRKGATGHWAGDRTQTTLWQIDKPHKSETGHSTQKPVECMQRPMRNHEAPEVYDPFLGSGTSIVAAEQLGRRCFGMEIEPGYVAVALQRWADMTGKTPTLANGNP